MAASITAGAVAAGNGDTDHGQRLLRCRRDLCRSGRNWRRRERALLGSPNEPSRTTAAAAPISCARLAAALASAASRLVLLKRPLTRSSAAVCAGVNGASEAYELTKLERMMSGASGSSPGRQERRREDHRVLVVRRRRIEREVGAHARRGHSRRGRGVDNRRGVGARLRLDPGETSSRSDSARGLCRRRAASSRRGHPCAPGPT